MKEVPVEWLLREFSIKIYMNQYLINDLHDFDSLFDLNKPTH